MARAPSVIDEACKVIHIWCFKNSILKINSGPRTRHTRTLSQTDTLKQTFPDTRARTLKDKKHLIRFHHPGQCTYAEACKETRLHALRSDVKLLSGS